MTSKACRVCKTEGACDLLAVRVQVYEAAGKWEVAAEIAQAICKLVPDSSLGFVKLAYALHELGRTKEAREVLLPVVDKFADEHLISYNLACYCCQLGQRKEAWHWIKNVFDLADRKEVKLMALDDPDLKPLWTDIAQI
jgi:predicted Zn-dependent protease